MTSARMAKPGTGFASEFSEIAKTIAIALAIAFVPRVVVCQPVTIPSSSMEPTLLVGDYVIISKFPYGWSRHSVPFSPPLGEGRIFAQAPKRGDIVVFKAPRDGRTDIIKRLVGLPGDRMQVVQGVLQINGQPVKQEPGATSLEDGPAGGAIRVSQFRETLPNGRSFTSQNYGPDTPAGNTGVYLVPAGCYFMMGDNRDNSLDSRFDPGQVRTGEASCPWNSDLDRYLPPEVGMGFVPFDDLVGRADMVLFSWRQGASLLKPWAGLRLDRMFHKLGAPTAT
ncbi:MAG: signal peptidase I [Pseudomonadota bacterium]|uniref:signal peptidase I n=1 Tax=Phenylobacterium sp. TaxID=1871053 RepID=UPI003112F71A